MTKGFMRKLLRTQAEKTLKNALTKELGKKNPGELRIIAEKLDAGLRQAKGNELISGFCHIGKHESCQQTGIMPKCACECHKKA